MLSFLESIIDVVRKANQTFYRDARVAHLPLLGSPWPMACIILLYILVVKRWGPRIMAQREPFNVTHVMQAYNLLQIAINLYIFVGGVRYWCLQPQLKISCAEYNPQDTSYYQMNLRYSFYAYYMTKYLDLLDTIFFVLRKKNNQISFLHVYHHSMMIFVVWAYGNRMFGSHFASTGMLNSFVHVCMYLYYFMAALKLESFDLMPWKRRLTQVQILQFCLLFAHMLMPLLDNWCKLDLFWAWVNFAQVIIMLSLFVDFYIKHYIIKPKRV